MGKDGSGEPATKKFKQSQLCFKSPKANGSLKSKVSSPLNNENVCKSQKIHSSDTSKAANDSLEVDSSKGSQEKTAPLVESVPSPSDNKENVSDSTNVPETSAKEVSEHDTKENKDECVPMDVDSPPDVTSVEEESKPSESNKADEQPITNKPSAETENKETDKQSNTIKPSVKKESGKSNDKQSDADKPSESEVDTSTSDSLSRNEDSKEAMSENPSEANTPSKTDKSALTDVSVTSANESLSPKSEITISSDSENEGGATSSSSTPVTPKTPRLMTPKMAKRHEESVKKKQLEQKLKEERRARRDQLKNERIQMKKEEEEKKKQMKEERKKKRIAELELKNEEKRQKHEEKRQKDEDKKQRKEREEEERRLQKEQKAEEKRKEEEKKEQEEKKKERAQAAFVSFFKKQPGSSSGNTATSSSNDTSTVSSESPAFMPFPVKSDMRLAAIVRRQLSESERQGLDSVMKGEGETNTYLQVLKQRSYSPRTSSQTWLAPVSEELHDCIVIEAQVEDQGEENGEVPDSSNHTKTTRRGKLLQFCENRRPAYFGTWTKQSKHVSGRNPFAKDSEGVLDYEVDSDSDWEEEEEGEDLESVKDDDNEAQEEELEEGENGYLLDNTFVPHGYLSDEEQPDEDDIHESVEKQKDRLVALKEEFDEEMKQGGAQALKPKLLGCLWVSNSTTQVSKGSLYEVLLSHRAIWDESNCPAGIDMEPEVTPVNEKSPTQTPPSKKLPEIVLQEIANMVDGSRWPLSRLVREVGEVLTIARPQNPISRLALTRAIKQMAAKTLDSKGKSVWTIKPEFRSEYKLQDLEEVVTPEVITPVSRVKSKDTLLDNFLRGGHQQKPDKVLGAPPAKKRISLTPVIQTPPEEKMEVTPEPKKALEVKPIIKKRVALVALPPRTPGSTPQSRSLPRTPGPWPSSEDKQSALKTHIDTPRPPVNKFLIKASPSQPQDPIVISDESNP